MSNLSRDAQELLTGSPLPDKTDADEPKTPAEEKIEERLAAIDTTPPAWRREPPKPPTTVPAETFQTVEAKAVAAEARAAALQAAWEGQGGSIDAEGNPIPPMPGAIPGAGGPQGFGTGAPMVPPHQWEATQALAEQLNIEPALLVQALGEYANAIGATGTMGSMIDNVVAATEKTLETSDPDFSLIRDSYRYHLSVLPPTVRASPLASEMALRLARGENFEKLAERWASKRSGKVVGRFVESAAAGTEEEPSAPQFSESTLDWAKRNNVSPRQIAEAEKRREVSGRNRRE